MENNKLLHTIVTLLSLYVSTIAQTAPNYVPSNGLVGWWPFNGNSNDGSGNGNNGAVYGATLTNDRNGNANSAYLTSTGYLMCGNTNIPTNGVMTVAIWFKNYSDFNIGEVVCLGSTSNTTWGCVMGHNYFTTNYGRGCSSTGSSPSNISIDTNWHHVVFVSGGLNTTTNIYFDGMFFGTTTNANSNGSCDFTNLYFGNDIYSGDSHGLYNGILDDIGIWNRNLDSCEIKDLYFGSLGNCNTSGINRNI